MRWFRAAGKVSGAKIRRGVILPPAALALCFSLAAFVSVAGGTGTKDPPWVAKDWTQWSVWDCENIWTYSPWAYYWDVGGRETGPTVFKNMQGRRGYYLVRLSSALPIRQAFLRYAQLAKRYDRMSAQEKLKFDQEYARDDAKYDASQVVIFWWSYDNSWPGQSRQGALVLGDGSLAMPIKTKLYCDQTVLEAGQIEHHVSTCAEYVFPRTVNGKPLYAADDKELVFVQGAVLPYHGNTEELGPQRLEDFRLAHWGPSGHGYRFPTPTLMYKGKLEY